MNQHEFETAVLRMWTTTRIPLTRVNIQVYTDTPRDRIEKWLDAMLKANLIELDSDDSGEAFWTVRGAPRSTTGPRTIDEWHRWEKLNREVSGDRAIVTAARPLARERASEGELAVGGDQKSLAASGLLAFFFGPLGWIYAAPLQDAIPAFLVLVALKAVLPLTVFASVMGVVSPLSALAGVAYAWSYNKTGQRVSLLTALNRAMRR
jgi:hypothetical protein